MTQQPLVHGRPAASTPVTVLQELELFKRTSENCQLTPAVINDLGHCGVTVGHCGVTAGHCLQATGRFFSHIYYYIKYKYNEYIWFSVSCVVRAHLLVVESVMSLQILFPVI